MRLGAQRSGQVARIEDKPPRIGIHPDHAHAGLGKGHGERKPDVAEPDDTDRRVAALEPLHEIRRDTAPGTTHGRHRQASLWIAALTASATVRTSSSRSSG
jgi:hypothetical protein